MRFERQGSGPVVVLVPGLGCDGKMWSAVAGGLDGRFTVIRPETWGSGSLHAAAQGISAILEDLGASSAGVAGLSMGGYITFELLRHWPQQVKAAALLDTTAFGDSPEKEEARHQVVQRIHQGEFTEVLVEFVSSVLAHDLPREGPEWQTMLAMARDLGADVFAGDMAAILKRNSYEDVLKLVRVPTLFAAGEHDALTSADVARRMAAEVPGARVEVIPHAAHMTALENPDAVTAVLSDFFGHNLGTS